MFLKNHQIPSDGISEHSSHPKVLRWITVYHDKVHHQRGAGSQEINIGVYRARCGMDCWIGGFLGMLYAMTGIPRYDRENREKGILYRGVRCQR